MTDIPTNGHRPPTGPTSTPADAPPRPGPAMHGALPIPELTGAGDVSEVLGAFGGIDLTRSATAASGSAATPTPPVTPMPDAAPPGAITDEDRNRYGMLLDHAAERGLLDQYEYEARLGDLAAATTVDEMHEIVTELPILAAPLTRPSSPKGRSPRASPLGAAGSIGTARQKPRSSPWLVLVVMVVVLVAALVFFAVYAGHITHARGAATSLMQGSTLWSTGAG